MNVIDATNLHRLMNCNGSRRMPAAFPVIDDPTARDEGTAAHYMAQQMLWGVDLNSLIDTKAPNGVVMTAEMADYVLIYVQGVTGGLLSPDRAGEIECDTSYGNDQWRVNGRADRVYHCVETCTLYVDDFKYGWTAVSPEMNWTLISHAVGYMMARPHIASHVLRIVTRIHQPRPYHPDGKTRSWEIIPEQLSEYASQIALTMSNPRDELRTGYEWCRKCHALANCPAARAARMNAIDAATASVFTDEMPNDALAYELDTMRGAKAMMEAQLNALEELTAHRLRNGQIVDGYALEPQYANTRWKTGLSPEALTVASGINCVKPSAITPAEAKRRGMPEHIVKALTDRPQTGIKLIRTSADRRAQRLLGK
jgi:hypothetical protein